MRFLDSGITSRVEERIRADLRKDADPIVQLLHGVESGNQDRERVSAAVVLGAEGDLGTLRQLIDLSRIDWRDVLVNGGLANTDRSGSIRRMSPFWRQSADWIKDPPSWSSVESDVARQTHFASTATGTPNIDLPI